MTDLQGFEAPPARGARFSDRREPSGVSVNQKHS
jgi:hypothetical protein